MIENTPYGCLTFIFYQKYFSAKMVLRLFYFHVIKWFILEGSNMFFTCLYNVCKKVRMQCVTNSGKNHFVTKFRCCYQPWDELVKFLFFTDFALQSNSKSRILLHHWREDNGKQSSAELLDLVLLKRLVI